MWWQIQNNPKITTVICISVNEVMLAVPSRRKNWLRSAIRPHQVSELNCGHVAITIPFNHNIFDFGHTRKRYFFHFVLTNRISRNYSDFDKKDNFNPPHENSNRKNNRGVWFYQWFMNHDAQIRNWWSEGFRLLKNCLFHIETRTFEALKQFFATLTRTDTSYFISHHIPFIR